MHAIFAASQPFLEWQVISCARPSTIYHRYFSSPPRLFFLLPFASRLSFAPITDISVRIDYANSVVRATCYYRSRIETRGRNVDVPVFSTRIARFFSSRSFQFLAILRLAKPRTCMIRFSTNTDSIWHRSRIFAICK